MKKIDAHQHFWNYDPGRDTWITEEMSVLQRDYGPEELGPLLKQAGYTGCVAVQADQSEAETHFLLDLADRHNFVLGVVGWLDLRAINLEERLEHFCWHPKLCGLRHIVQAESDDFLLSEEFQRGIARLSYYGLSYDLLILPPQLKAAAQLAARFPGQKFVVDHLAKPYIKEGNIEEWKRDLESLARHPNVWCKLSGMVTEAEWKAWKPEDFTPYLDTALEAYGPGKLMIGSDWPVCLLAGAYEEVTGLVEAYLSRLTETEQRMILGDNAIEFYGLEIAD